MSCEDNRDGEDELQEDYEELPKVPSGNWNEKEDWHLHGPAWRQET
jgi:hypothetical protein